ncbi:MBL fold metallo-hydrolase [Candidatus Woesearchaeota archaeon]|nr:MBL fold metallo-hydrolase [Candidatus Woesearchaeota archaeon]
MELSVLASGSGGNSTFIGSKNTQILFDAGLSCRQIERRLSSIGKSIDEVDAIFVSHEHIDHIRGLDVLQRKHDIPVYANKETYENSSISSDNINFFKINEQINLNGFKIQALKTSHDAANPCGFMVNHGDRNLGIFTDLGCITENIRSVVNRLDAIVLEANHDIDMLLKGPYPYYLKQRILSNEGHLSNIDAGLCLKENATRRLKTVFLAHLSRNNNTPELAYSTFTTIVNQSRLRLNTILTDQFKATELIKV